MKIIEKIIFLTTSILVIGCITTSPKSIGNGEWMIFTNCVQGDSGADCFSDLEKKATKDCNDKNLNYKRIRFDLIPGTKLFYKCSSLD